MATIPATWTVLQHFTRDYEVDRGPLEGTSRVVQVAAVRDIGGSGGDISAATWGKIYAPTLICILHILLYLPTNISTTIPLWVHTAKSTQKHPCLHNLLCKLFLVKLSVRDEKTLQSSQKDNIKIIRLVEI